MVTTTLNQFILIILQMKIHKMETYALYNKKFSSFALYEGKYGGSCNPYKISSKFQPRNQDMTYVVSLRKWVESFQLDTGTILEILPL